jgi:uncharacterized protein YqgC (DUF456 family)
MVIVYYILLLVLVLAGVVLTVATLPGTWLILLVTIGYGALTHSAGYVGIKSIVALFLLAVSGELIDIFGSGAGAKKAGASRRAMLGAVVGGLLGAIFLSFILFFPVGTIAGACIGCFVGSGLMELWARRDVGQSVRVGFHAAKGRLMSIFGRIMVALIMFAVAAWTALPISPHKVLQPQTLPASNPAPTTSAIK